MTTPDFVDALPPNARLDAIPWIMHAPTALALAGRPADGRMRVVVAECSGHGRDTEVSIREARRLAACWNALIGATTEEIENGGITYAIGPQLLMVLTSARDVLGFFLEAPCVGAEVAFFVGQLNAIIQMVGAEDAAAMARAAINVARVGGLR